MKLDGPLPEHFLSKLPPEERRKLGRVGLTSEEAQASYVARSERELQRDVAQWLNKREFYFTNPRPDKKTTLAKGAPDFIAAVDSKFVAIETKCIATKGKLRPEQEDTMRRVTNKQSKGIYLVIHSIQELEQAFAAL